MKSNYYGSSCSRCKKPETSCGCNTTACSTVIGCGKTTPLGIPDYICGTIYNEDDAVFHKGYFYLSLTNTNTTDPTIGQNITPATWSEPLCGSDLLNEFSRGPAGRDGADGRDGVGKDGKDGRDGRDGVDGVDGRDGVAGLDGRDGSDGQSYTPDNIVNGLDPTTYTCPATGVFSTLDSATGLMYFCNEGVLGAGISFGQGADGIDGRDGRDGVDGVGRDGRDGEDGLSYSPDTIVNNFNPVGFSCPTNGISSILDATTGQMYFCVDGVLGDAIPFGQGPQGVAGNDGSDGAAGLDGLNGAAGQDGLDGLSYVPDAVVTTFDPSTYSCPATGASSVLDASSGLMYFCVDGVLGSGISFGQGPQGYRGLAGVNGTNGLNGTNGVDGKDGADGRDGIDGISIKGDKGDDGISYQPDAIIPDFNPSTYTCPALGTVSILDPNSQQIYFCNNGAMLDPVDFGKGEKGDRGEAGRDGLDYDPNCQAPVVENIECADAKGNLAFTFSDDDIKYFHFKDFMPSAYTIAAKVDNGDGTYSTVNPNGSVITWFSNPTNQVMVVDFEPNGLYDHNHQLIEFRVVSKATGSCIGKGTWLLVVECDNCNCIVPEFTRNPNGSITLNDGKGLIETLWPAGHSSPVQPEKPYPADSTCELDDSETVATVHGCVETSYLDVPKWNCETSFKVGAIEHDGHLYYNLVDGNTDNPAVGTANGSYAGAFDLSGLIDFMLTKKLTDLGLI